MDEKVRCRGGHVSLGARRIYRSSNKSDVDAASKHPGTPVATRSNLIVLAYILGCLKKGLDYGIAPLYLCMKYVYGEDTIYTSYLRNK